MAEIRSMYKYLILVPLVACLAIPSAEGRQIKSMNKKEVSSDMRERAKQGSGSIMNARQSIEGKKKISPPPTRNFADSEASYKDNYRPTRPGISPGAGHSFGQGQQSAESKLVSDNSHKANDFWPTSPGISPGVGQSFAQDQQNGESELVADNSHKAEHFKTGVKEDFRPTTPGHSPGIGHASRDKNAEPTA